MKILALENKIPGKISGDFAPYLKDEAYRVWELYQAGVIREIYFRQERNEAVLVLECEDPTQADETLNTLPLVQQKLIRFELIPLVPYPGFGRLFSTGRESPILSKGAEDEH